MKGSGFIEIYTLKTYNQLMQYEFIESSLFTKMVYDYLSEEDFTAFQQFLLEQPEAVDLIKGSGGVWVCYYTRNAAGQILLLVIYAKSVRASISGAVLKQLKEMLE